jgi:hypothetical protein
MTFHKTDRVEYIRSGRKKREKNLQTRAEYFESIYDTQAIETTYSRSQHKKVQGDARKQARHDLQERYVRKMHHFSVERRPRRYHSPRNNNYYGRRELREGGERHYGGCNDKDYYKKSPQVYRKSPQGYDYKRNPQERGLRKSPQDYKKGGVQPCLLHGPCANHSYAECCQNPRNQVESKLRDNKRALDSHHQDMCAHDNRYLSSDDESRGDNYTPVPSDGEVSASIESKGC